MLPPAGTRPIPWYLRVGYNHHRLVENKLSAGDPRINRAVLDAARAGADLIKLDHALSDHPELQKRIQRKRRFVDDLRLTLESLNVETDVNVRRSLISRRAPFRPMPAVQRNNQRPTL